MAAYHYYPARAWLLLLFQPVYYAWFMAPHTAALSFSYNFSNTGDLDRANLDYLGDSKPGDRIINLTADGFKSIGRVAYPQTVRLWDDRTGRRASFTTDFSFAINNRDTHDRGDGMAFFIGESRREAPQDSSGAFLGLFNNPANQPPPQKTVGVEFDTNNNANWDPPNVYDHIGIDVNSISSKVHLALGSALPNPLSGNMSATVKYDGRSKVLSVNLMLADGTFHQLETTVDLKAEGVPRDATVGFSAATGDLVESHQLLSWSFSSTDPSKLELWVVLLLAVASVAFAALVTGLLWVICWAPSTDVKLPVAKKFSYQELCTATNNFSEDRKLGKGAFGEVYRGELGDQDKSPVAVKRLTRLTTARTRRDYVTEIMTLGQLSHRNLVKLVGWCNGGGGCENLVKLVGWCNGGGGSEKLLLVYELVTNGNLHDHLHGSSQRLLTWAERYKIVRGIGAAIEYLHTGKENPILHRDIKPSNVMLDDELDAKLGDFGLVRPMEPRQGSLGGTVAGDMAYLDPVCVSKDTVSIESDVYSFGVLLLEIATGKSPAAVLDTGGVLSSTLVNAVRESYGKGYQVLRQMVDERLNGDFDESQMKRVLVVGLLCVQQQREHRPKIRDAVNLLSDLRHPVPQIVS